MKKSLLILALCLFPSLASAQCSGVFAANTVCGRGAAEVAGSPHQVSGASISTGLIVGTTTITGGSNSSTYQTFLTNNNGVLANGHIVDIGPGIPAGAALHNNNFNVYPINVDNGVQLGYGTGLGIGLGGSVTFFTKNTGGTAPVIHQELGFIQAYTFVNGAYNFSGAPVAIVFGTTEAWTPTANGQGFVFQTTLLGTTSATGELSIADGMTVMAASDTTITTGLGRGTLNARNGSYDGGNRVLSASNLIATKNQNASTVLQIVNSTNNTAALAGFTASSDVANLQTGAASTLFSTALFAGRSFVNGGGGGLLLSTSSTDPIVIAPNVVERARVLLGLMVGTTTDPGAGIINVLTGFRIGNAATSGNVLRGNGTNFVSATLACSDLSGAGTGCSSAAGITALTGDGTATGPGSVALTLATVNANTGSWGSATAAPQFTVNGKGLITAAANVTITPAVGSITGLGTGVATALAINVGSAGAFVTFNGALGTPSSGTVTNLTGTASININGTVGATTPTTGVFTTVTASTSLTSPLHIGSSGTTGTTLEHRNTSGTGTTDQQIFTGGTNGGTRIATMLGTGLVGFGSAAGAAVPTNTQVVISRNATTVDAAQTAVTPVLHLVGNTNELPGQIIDAFGTLFGTIAYRAAGGTAASKTAITADSALGKFLAYGWDTAAYGGGAVIGLFAGETFSASAHGSYIDFSTVALTTTTQQSKVRIQGSGGVSIGNGVITTDPGAGGIVANGATIRFTALASDTAQVDNTVCINSTGVLLKGTGALGVCLGTSGAQFKTAFAPMAAGINDLMRIDFQTYRYREGFGDNGAHIQYGTTAQNVAAAIPDLVRYNAVGEAINYDSGALLFIGLRAIQQLKADNDNLRLELATLKKG